MIPRKSAGKCFRGDDRPLRVGDFPDRKFGFRQCIIEVLGYDETGQLAEPAWARLSRHKLCDRRPCLVMMNDAPAVTSFRSRLS